VMRSHSGTSERNLDQKLILSGRRSMSVDAVKN